ncbi:MAG: GIY-YIG nuclease family protein [Planctomycetota bacterium]
MKYKFVYRTVNTINNKEYIGVHVTDDLNDGYLGSGKLLIKDVKEYGRSHFSMTPIKFFDTEKEAYLYEGKLVNKEYTGSDNTYNIIAGGTGHPTFYGKNHPRFINLDEEKILELYDNGVGMSMCDIGKTMGCSYKPIERVLKSHGVDTSIAIINRLRKGGKTWKELYPPEVLRKMLSFEWNPYNKGKKLKDILKPDVYESFLEGRAQRAKETHTGRKRSSRTCRNISNGLRNSDKVRRSNVKEEDIRKVMDNRLKLGEIAKELDVSIATYYRYKKKYGL